MSCCRKTSLTILKFVTALKNAKQKDNTQPTEGKQGDKNYVAYAVIRNCCFLCIDSHMNQFEFNDFMVKL